MNLHIGRVCIEGIFCVEFVETLSRVKQYLPDVIYVSSPFVEASLYIELVSFRVDQRVEDWVFKNQSWAVSIWVVIGYQDFKPENPLLVNALTNEDDAKPCYKREIVLFL